MKKNDLGGACRKYGGKERCVQGFGWEREGNRPLGRPIRRWEDNIEVDYIGLAENKDRWLVLVNAVMSPQVP